MIIETRPEIDFSTFPETDGKPMADNETNLDQMIDLILALRQPLEPLGHHVGGNLLMYWNPDNGHEHIAPDVFVALDSGPERRQTWKTWEEGKFPEIVFEIASPSTRNRDIGAKVALYALLGAREYYIFDPARRLNPAFRGYTARRGEMVALPNPTGESIVSTLLDLELRVVAGWLRVIDPISGQPYPLPREERAALRTAEHARRDAEQARHEAEVQVAREVQARQSAEQARQRAEQARSDAEKRADQEAQARQQAEQARQAAEARIAALEARLRAAQTGEPRDEGESHAM